MKHTNTNSRHTVKLKILSKNKANEEKYFTDFFESLVGKELTSLLRNLRDEFFISTTRFINGKYITKQEEKKVKILIDEISNKLGETGNSDLLKISLLLTSLELFYRMRNTSEIKDNINTKRKLLNRTKGYIKVTDEVVKDALIIQKKEMELEIQKRAKIDAINNAVSAQDTLSNKRKQEGVYVGFFDEWEYETARLNKGKKEFYNKDFKLRHTLLTNHPYEKFNNSMKSERNKRKLSSLH